MHRIWVSLSLSVYLISLYGSVTSAVNICTTDTFNDFPRLLCGNITAGSTYDLTSELQNVPNKDQIRTVLIDNTGAIQAAGEVPLGRTLTIDLESKMFIGFTALTRLQIRYATLHEVVAKSFSAVAGTLEYLGITNCKGVSDSFPNIIFSESSYILGSLKRLHLDRNIIKGVIDVGGIFALAPKLENLTLSGNRIQTFSGDTSKGGWSTLKFLDLSYNLGPVSDTVTPPILNSAVFGYFPNLEWLSLQQDGVSTVKFQEILQMLPTRLLALNVGNNLITNTLPIQQFSRLSSLQNLTLSGNFNMLSAVNFNGTVVLPLMPALETLSVQSTGISNVPLDLLVKLPRLTTLDARNNALTVFPNSLTAQFWNYGRNPRTRLLLLQGNPLTCSCDNYNLMHWLSPSVGHKPSGDAILCLSGSQPLCPTCELSGTGRIGLETALGNEKVTALICPAIPAHNENSGAEIVPAVFVLSVTLVVANLWSCFAV